VKDKLSRLPLHYRLLISLIVNSLFFLSILQSKRTRIHWVGNLRRFRRVERHLFIVLLLVPLVLLEPRQYLFWSVVWGGAASAFVIVMSSLRLFKKVNA